MSLKQMHRGMSQLSCIADRIGCPATSICSIQQRVHSKQSLWMSTHSDDMFRCLLSLAVEAVDTRLRSVPAQSELEKHGNEPVWLTRTGPDTPIPDYIADPVGVLRGMQQANALQVSPWSCQSAIK